LGPKICRTSARRRKSDDHRNQQKRAIRHEQAPDPVENFLKASKDYSDALHEHYRDSSDDSVLEAAKAAMKGAEKALRTSRNPKS
jgi:chromosome condensin MukBEF MukE localization factor